MSKSHDRFFNEINEMIVKRQYNEQTVDKLLNIIVVSQMLAEREKNEDVKQTLLHICTVGEALAKRLYVLRNK